MKGKKFYQIAAERSISPEKASKDWVQPNGSGATSVIQRYLTDSSLPSSLIEDVLLRELNSIFEPDNRFTRIFAQRHNDESWEIYLEEVEKGGIPLSASGSGLQTIILVLLVLHVFTAGNHILPVDLVVGIEEPENNLHPALQRRLLTYLQKFHVEHGVLFFITTHSTVAIDQFVGQRDAKLFHVRHDGRAAKVNEVHAYSDGHEILRDLDVRASDLLQSNGIIWVEGPTDRLYVNKWIEIASDGRLREGANYQCVFYGGKLLSHLSADGDLSVKKDLIDLITVNRNAAILIDSDRRGERGRLNTTKTRIKYEFDKINSFVWVTKGREIENYLDPRVIRDLFGTDEVIGKFDSVMDWVLSDAKRKRVASDKMSFASKAVARILDDSFIRVLDLREQIDGLMERISQWNNLTD